MSWPTEAEARPARHARPAGGPDVVLALDLGTGSLKAALITAGGDVLRRAAQAYPAHSPQPGWSESHPDDWWAAAQRAAQDVLRGRDPARVRAVSLSGQMHGVTLTAPTGEALRPAVLWSDTRSAPQLEAYHALPEPLLRHLRNPPVTGFAGPTLLWLAAHEPAALAAARWALQPKDWLRLHLTGEAATDPSDASGTLLFDPQRQDWHAGLLERLGLPAALLPPIRPSGSVAGFLRPAPARALGLPAGLPVLTGAADTAAALHAADPAPGEAQLTVGTGAQIAVSRADLPGPHPALHAFRDAAQGWYQLAAVQNAGNVLEWVRRTLRLSWPDMYLGAQQTAGPATPLFLPYLTGDRTPHLNPHARAGWLELGADHGPGHLAYAAFEGVALSIAQAAEQLDLPRAHPLRLAGGGTLEPWWQQLLADALNRPLHVTDAPDASLRGAARLAWTGLGVPWTGEAGPARVTVHPSADRISQDRRERFGRAADQLMRRARPD
ncbi:sugar kinase [Deinococcus indicus]|uniref:xylulokinase n=1 Tax=Deinococcus indicus TaxID=223556 RepID=UPI00174E11A5|nr:FGGY family carbohydrate kinase [Deinococcus indicus]GHG26484.1 sugar kinase [Deinococcus indicus]